MDQRRTARRACFSVSRSGDGRSRRGRRRVADRFLSTDYTDYTEIGRSDVRRWPLHHPRGCARRRRTSRPSRLWPRCCRPGRPRGVCVAGSFVPKFNTRAAGDGPATSEIVDHLRCFDRPDRVQRLDLHEDVVVADESRPHKTSAGSDRDRRTWKSRPRATKRNAAILKFNRRALSRLTRLEEIRRPNSRCTAIAAPMIL